MYEKMLCHEFLQFHIINGLLVIKNKINNYRLYTMSNFTLPHKNDT